MLKAGRWQPFGDSVFSQTTKRAQELGALNLAQGFPDFPGPSALLQSQSRAIFKSSNQYVPSKGIPELLDAIQVFSAATLGESISFKQTETMVTPGATAGVFCGILGTVNPGERVLCFEPFYESYRMAVDAAGGVFVPIPLRPPDLEIGSGWQIDWAEVHAAASLPFKCFVLNTPHNPTGLCLEIDDFEMILKLCRERGAYALCDEVYEHLTFDGHEHISVLHVARPGRDVVLRVTSIAKSFGFTGFKLGWIQGSKEVVDSAYRVLQSFMFCLPAALQLGFALYLNSDLPENPRETWSTYLEGQRGQYQQKRDKILEILTLNGLEVGPAPKGAYFVCATAANGRWRGRSDLRIAELFMNELGIAVLPLTAFCLPWNGVMGARNNMLHRFAWIRFAFCKGTEALNLFQERLSKAQSSFWPES